MCLLACNRPAAASILTRCITPSQGHHVWRWSLFACTWKSFADDTGYFCAHAFFARVTLIWDLEVTKWSEKSEPMATLADEDTGHEAHCNSVRTARLLEDCLGV